MEKKTVLITGGTGNMGSMSLKLMEKDLNNYNIIEKELTINIVEKGTVSIIKDNNIDKKDCLYIGDTDVDKESANSADISYRLVSYGYRNEEELKKICPNDIPFSSVKELTNYLLMWVNS